MKRFMLGMFILLFVVTVSCVGGVKKAEALSMRFTQGVNVVTVHDDMVGDNSAVDGKVAFDGIVGLFDVNFNTASSYPWLRSPSM